ncbi:FG-GAP-like repeat-containing protein [Rhizobacter sp. OV335]|uniref:FG-GAP-like repeat-containing protein n=1 Tax=Rhizobacter sp. OV335 TaxID=1500264 RepID=UPI00091CB49A|nr:FG-GAP-like repeat-containing protein [Rhizobacter sp. OV335]SHN35572.1 Repeat domain-containing protein [Rhizobacter sp. OV335]
MFRMEALHARGGVPAWQVARRAAALVACALLASVAQAQMAIPGSFSVSPDGAATYGIPIQVPPGIAGIEPSLTLGYNSRSGNGPLGVGWNVSGLSQITRCPQTVPQDGAQTGVNYTSSDRFCLDGQRLMVVAGTYGAAGSEYRTELESFSKVVANGAAAGGGPTSFVVKTKAGLTMEFGNSADSSIEVVGKTPLVIRAWPLNKIVDTKGNTLTVTYQKDTTNGVFNGGYYPLQIDYTGNATTGLLPASNVQFAYETIRTDGNVGYQAGFPVTNRLRLRAIATNSVGVNVLSYQLTYVAAPQGTRSRIESIKVCSASAGCLPEIVIQAPSGAPGSIGFGSGDSPSPADLCLATCGSWQAIDINHDGISDLVHLKDSAGHYSIWLSKGDGTFNVTEYTTNEDLTVGSWQVMDVDGDGIQDLIHLKDNSGNFSFWFSTGQGAFAISPQPVNTVDRQLTEGTWRVLDVNGDGLPDLMHFPATSIAGAFVWRSTGTPGNGFVVTQVSNSAGDFIGTPGSGPIFTMDLNGDGRADVIHLSNKFLLGLFPNSGYAGIVTWMSNGDSTFNIVKSANPGAVTSNDGSAWQVLDVNGDGLPDLINLSSTTGGLVMWLAKGDGTFAASQFTSVVDTNLANGSWQVVDVNGDGLNDLIHLTTNNYEFQLWRSRGDGTFAVSGPRNAGVGDQCLTCGRWLAMDTMGDGYKTDLIHMNDDLGHFTGWYPTRFQGSDRILNGLGGEVSWTLKGLAEVFGKLVSSYSMLVSSVDGRWTVIPPMQVVTASQVSDGLGGFRKTSYSYDSAQMERNGRGFLGFNWLQSVDEATGVVTRTISNLNFPYTGMTTQALQGLSLASGFNLGSTTTTYDCIDPASTTIPPAPCTVGPGKRYFVYPKTVEARTWELNGKPMPRTRTETLDVDAYGNVGRIITSTLDANGNATGYAKTVVNTYAAPDLGNWYLGRLLKSTVTSTGPDIPAPVVQGTGGLPPAPPPQLPASVLQVILSILLDD